LFTVAPYAIAPAGAAVPIVVEAVPVTPTLSERALRVRVTEIVERSQDRVSLTDARVVIGGGRGVGSAENFEALEELASILGGAVGCSRAVTSLGWRPHADQIGQTGNRIAPDLYIACGVSGAIQHMIGCKAAKKILAINTDPEATIVAKADYAVIGDLNKVVPAITEELRKSKFA
jgi:electron transfer flavoprotein alpha subunit